MMATSPIHVHVQDNTPLHVHVKKPKKNDISKKETKRNTLRPGPRAKTKSVPEPWIPAPGRTSTRDRQDKNYKWDSERALLEINPQFDLNMHAIDDRALRQSELSTEEDNRLRGHINDYEKKIETLMAEVGTLKNETKDLSLQIVRTNCAKCSGDVFIAKLEKESRQDPNCGNSVQTCTLCGLNILCESERVNSMNRRNAEHLEQEKQRRTADREVENFDYRTPEPHVSKAIAADYRQSACMKKKTGGYFKDYDQCVHVPLVTPRASQSYCHWSNCNKKAECGFEEVDQCSDELLVTPKLSPEYFSQSQSDTDSDDNPSEAIRKSSSKVTFKDPLLEYYYNKKNEKKDKISGRPLPRAEMISYEEWGRSFGVVKAPSLELKQVEKELEDREDQLEVSKAVLEDKQKELRFISKEFEETEKENARLRKSMDRYQDDLAVSLEKFDTMTSDDDALHRHLVQVEICGAEAGKQVAALRDVIQRLKYEKRLSHSDVNALNRQRELFLQKLSDFETSNRTVRRLLQAEHKTLSDVKRLESQRDTLMTKLADSDSDILRLRSELIQKSNSLEQLISQVNEEKNHAHTLNELNKSVETTRAHLQRELRTKEMDNNRLHVQLKNMERDSHALREEAERLSAAAKSERESIAAEKEGLKRAARSLRSRAEKAEDTLKDVELALSERERKLDEARSQADGWRERYQRASDEKARLEDHVQSLADKVTEKESVSRTNVAVLKSKEEEMKKQLDRLTSDNVRYRSELERCKTDSSFAEERCRKAQQDAAALRADNRQQEGIEADLRAQLRKAKNEAEEALLTVEKVERSSRRMREEGSGEIERVKEQMLERMRELQPLPELLKETEMKLQDTQDKLHVYEQRSAEQTRIIAELSNKDGAYVDEASVLKQRVAALNDENRALEARLQILHVKLDDRDMRVKESVIDTVNKDERLQQLQLKMEEVNHEKDSLKRQLESAVSDSRKAVESEIDKSTARDRTNQTRIVDLETNITRLKADVAAVKRTKEDMDRRHQSKLQDAKDRLEQAESTNRSMRNYVNFLKKSYTNVFGADSSLTSTPIRSGPSDAPQSSFY